MRPLREGPPMLRRTYLPRHDQNLMLHEGDTVRARRAYFDGGSPNLRQLLRRRYEWMNRFIDPEDVGVDLGCGTGLSKEFVRAKEFQLSDVADYDWLDFKHVDALATPFDNESFDFVVCSNMIHHVAHPLVIFQEIERILKPGGRLIIQEVNASLTMRFLLRLMRHEGYSYEPDVFDPKVVCNDPQDPWSANCAIANLLFDDAARFERSVPGFRIIHSSFSECVSMINSGGVIAKTFYIPLPNWLMRVVCQFDTFLTRCFPQMFAMQRQIVLEKQSVERSSRRPALELAMAEESCSRTPASPQRNLTRQSAYGWTADVSAT
jgi:SAM-dependent methyltransferase